MKKIARFAAVLLFPGILFYLHLHNRSSRETPSLVLLYATCSLNKNYMSPYSRSVRYTPNFLEFSRESVTFTEHETDAGLSGAAYASLFSGNHMYRHGVYYHPAPLNDSNYLVAEAFQDHGYETSFWNMHYLASADLNYAQGVLPQNIHQQQPGDGYTLTPKDKKFSEILTRIRNDKNYRAFIEVNFSLTHAPYSKNSDLKSTMRFCRSFPEECRQISDQDLSELFPLYEKNYVPLAHRLDETMESLNLQPDLIPRLLHVLEVMYKSSISRLDHNFGQTIDTLRAAGVLDQSLIVFTSDHGESLERRGPGIVLGHSFPDPEVLAIPLMIRMAHGKGSGTRYEKITRSIDVFPTVAALSGIQLTGNNRPDGVDLSAAILRRKESPDLVAYSCSGLPHPAIGQDDVSTLMVQARSQNILFRLASIRDASKMQAFDLCCVGWREKNIFERQNKSHIQMEKELHAYRNRLIANYKRIGDESGWEEMRERLRSLGYLK